MTGNRRVAVVTGASSGIGAAAVRRLQSDGLAVVAPDLSESPSTPGDLQIRADVTDEGDVERAFSTIIETFGHLDVLVNNAGMTGSIKATVCHETPVNEWDHVLAVNARGPFLCARAALKTCSFRGTGTSSRSLRSRGSLPSLGDAPTPRPKAQP